jgi:hypothetical protein
VVAPDEDGLLHDYATDPAVTLVPEGAQRTGSVQRQHGCLQVDREDTSTTSVETSFKVSRDYDLAALRAVYDPVAHGNGWADIAGDHPDVPGADVFLFYCRTVREVTSELSISISSAQHIDIRASGPDRPPSPQWQVTSGGITVVIEAFPQRANCKALVNP